MLSGPGYVLYLRSARGRRRPSAPGMFGTRSTFGDTAPGRVWWIFAGSLRGRGRRAIRQAGLSIPLRRRSRPHHSSQKASNKIKSPLSPPPNVAGGGRVADLGLPLGSWPQRESKIADSALRGGARCARGPFGSTRSRRAGQSMSGPEVQSGCTAAPRIAVFAGSPCMRESFPLCGRRDPARRRDRYRPI